jgi:hypothetical protein
VSDQPASEPSKFPPGTSSYALESPHGANGWLRLIAGHVPLFRRAPLAAAVPAIAERINTLAVHASPATALIGVH